MPRPRPFDDAFGAELDRLFRWRRDVRHFQATSLPENMVAELVATASRAPSVGYSQPWRFVRVADAARRARIHAIFSACNAEALAAQPAERAALYARLKLSGLAEAPEHLAVFVDGEAPTGGGLGRATMPETLAFSAVLAIHTLWLAAAARGVGLGWVSILDPVAVAQALEVPAGWRLVAYLCLGYPVEPAETPELERCGWESRIAPSDLMLQR
ncbi:5,6-dimethylbenzimidazole synthase [Ancylobacter lacus]|uniref:5,6-dimethylbenzimidazole synthase n=1 Tax=Ancylobacter lacus TaxID=2579970 RepID=UPI001BCB67A3|nr:5,6-dimethylbenzimidazole synthase [Ancylobacter lacus]MBS7541282.1 5,6-dimethylbenzimidazole synthase [Ancylobacter lacus]